MSVSRDVLPGNVKPVHYDLEVYNINVIDNTFQGKVRIDLNVIEDSDKIVLHADRLKFHKVEVLYSATKTESNIEVLSTEFDQKAQTATLKLNEILKAGASSKAQLYIEYSAVIRNDMSGFYRSDYKDLNDKDQVLLSTQFEATDARSALPSFDEPNLKATFQLTITVAEDFTVLSNTPVVSSKVLGDGKKKGALEASGLKVVKFQQTPVMSTYLLAWAIGKLDYVESFTEKSYDGKRIPVRVYTQEGISEQGKFGLEVATKVVDFFSQVFDLDYVLPKLDLVSVPTYSHNAMENWGLITFRPTALLYDEKTSDSKYKKNVAYVISHELAHQWFGNLVTMDWWDELWLNEGFATWVGYYAVDYLFPEWRIFDINTATDLQSALEVDSLKSSHPVEVPIQSSSDIDQVFDHISYLKGGAVINQVARYLGVEVFLSGVSQYLKKHKYSNATTNDLLAAISEVSGDDVVSKADNWIRKIGFPVVHVKSKNSTGVEITQSRFLSSGEVAPEDDQTIWWIPLNISTGAEENEKAEGVSFSEKSWYSSALGKLFFKINKDTTGFYRTVYDETILHSIKSNLDKLSAADKVGLISDSVVTAIAGLSTTSSALDLLKKFRGETDYITWSALLSALSKISSAWYEQSEEVQEGLRKFTQELLAPTALSLEFEVTASESFLLTQFRSELLKAAVSAGIPEVVSKAKSIFANGGDIDPSLKGIIYQSVVSGPDATEADFDSVFDLIRTSKALDTREVVLGALGTVSNPLLISKAISLILDPEVPIMDVQFVAYPLAKNRKARVALLNYLKDNYDAIYARLNSNKVVFDRFVKFTLGYFASDQAYNTIKSIFEDKDIYGFERSLDQVLESVKSNAAWVKRDASGVETWLKDQKYI